MDGLKRILDTNICKSEALCFLRHFFHTMASKWHIKPNQFVALNWRGKNLHFNTIALLDKTGLRINI